jgi:hypothetical protein
MPSQITDPCDDPFVPITNYVRAHGEIVGHILYRVGENGKTQTMMMTSKLDDYPECVKSDIAHLCHHLVVDASFNGKFLTHDDEPSLRVRDQKTKTPAWEARLECCECCSPEARRGRVDHLKKGWHTAHFLFTPICDCEVERVCECCGVKIEEMD